MTDLDALKQALDDATAAHLAAIERYRLVRIDLDAAHEKWWTARRAYDAAYRAAWIQTMADRQEQSHALADQLTAEAQDMGLEP